jgi:hypothetical protein
MLHRSRQPVQLHRSVRLQLAQLLLQPGKHGVAAGEAVIVRRVENG